MKKLLMGFAVMFSMSGCMALTEPYGYDTVGNIVYYDVYDDYGYTYSYDEVVIAEITRRMVIELRLSNYEAQRLLELNRRYYYLFNRYPQYSWGYYAQPRPGYAPPGYGGRGPGYLAPPPRRPGDPYMRVESDGRMHIYNYNDRVGYGNRVLMTDKQMDKMADRYDKEMRKILNKDQFNTFSNRTSYRSVTTNNDLNVNNNLVNPNNTRQGGGNTGVSSRTTTTNPGVNNNGGRISSGENTNVRQGTTTPSVNTTTRQSTTTQPLGTVSPNQQNNAANRLQQRAGSGTTSTQPTTTAPATRQQGTSTRQTTTQQGTSMRQTTTQQGTSTRQATTTTRPQTTTTTSSRSTTRTRRNETTTSTPTVSTRSSSTTTTNNSTTTTQRNSNSTNNNNSSGGGARRR